MRYCGDARRSASAPVEATAAAGAAPGIYEVKLPPLEGAVPLAARLTISTRPETA